MAPIGKRLLLIDLEDSRREIRVRILKEGGYDVEVRRNFEAAELRADENKYDLVIISIAENPELVLAYRDELAKINVSIPILLLVGKGVYIPSTTFRQSLVAGVPWELMTTVASLLSGSTHIRELPRSL